jgi:hypothetical protein
MLTLLKKQSPEAVDPALTAWHPDFRNERRLPDTKVIRTSFLLNGVAFIVAALVLTWLCYRVFQLRELTNQIADWQLQIDRDQKPSAAAIAAYKKFQAETAQVGKVDAFRNSRPIVSDLLLELGKSLPDYVAVDRFDLSGGTLSIAATVRGAPDQASGRAQSYVQSLKTKPYFSANFAEISLVNLNRNAQTGSLVVDISFKFKDGKKL